MLRRLHFAAPEAKHRKAYGKVDEEHRRAGDDGECAESACDRERITQYSKDNNGYVGRSKAWMNGCQAGREQPVFSCREESPGCGQ